MKTLMVWLEVGGWASFIRRNQSFDNRQNNTIKVRHVMSIVRG